jgi:pyruvate dehydrogenase E1 component beta subunit
MNIGEIINQALKDIGTEDKNSIFMAQGIMDPTAVFGTLSDLNDVVPKARLLEMPVSESAAIGIAIGASMAGKRTIVSLHRVEFLLLALEQLFNNAAKANFLSGGIYSAPILIRAVIGRGWGQGPSHSQGFEGVFASIPGLKVVCPSVTHTAYDMIRSSYQDEAPVVCLEHRWVHYAKGDLIKSKSTNKKITPISLSKGSHLTIVTYGYMSLECLLVVNQFKNIGINLELIDLQIIRPLDLELVLESVRHTGRLLVVDQGHKFLGIGAEIVAQTVENCMDVLECPPVRLGLPSIPSPSSISLAKDYYCTAINIVEAITEMLPMEESAKSDIVGSVKKIRNVTSPDVPNEYFKGPF